MFKLKSIKLNGVEKDSSSAISNSELKLLLDTLNGKSLECEVSFEVTGINNEKKNYTLPDKSAKYSSIFELLKNECSIDLDTDIFSSAVINFDSQFDFKTLAESLSKQINSVADSTQSQAELESLNTEIENSLNEDQKSKFKRLVEVNNRIESVQEQIDFYQNEKKIKEELNSQIKKLNTDKNAITQMLESVELLIKNRAELTKKIDSHTPSQSYEKVAELKKTKLSSQVSKLFSSRVDNPLAEDDGDDNNKKKISINLNIPLVLIVANVLLTLLSFLYSFNIWVLLIGVFFTFILFIMLIISRFFVDSLSDIQDVELKNNKVVASSAPQPQAEDPNTQLFINSAWYNALKQELEILETSIQKNLNGKSYDNLKSQIDEIEDSIEQNNKKLEQIIEKSLTSDEYYKKRREVDILKIERENLEIDAQIKPDLLEKQKAIRAGIKQSGNFEEYLNNFRKTFPIFVVTKDSIEKVSESTKDLFNQVVLVIGN